MYERVESLNEWIDNLGENKSGEQEVCNEKWIKGSVKSVKGIAEN